MEKEMATHSSILAWEIPQTEEPGKLQSMGSQRVRRNRVTKQQQHIQEMHQSQVPLHKWSRGERAQVGR